MHHEIRMGMLKALILLRNKDLLPPLVLFELCFDLLKCEVGTFLLFFLCLIILFDALCALKKKQEPPPTPWCCVLICSSVKVEHLYCKRYTHYTVDAHHHTARDRLPADHSLVDEVGNLFDNMTWQYC